MLNTVAAHYRAADGSTHEVVVARTPEGRWRVLDVVPAATLIVETLTGYDDRSAQAEALAREYASEQQAFHDGRRDSDPLPRPEPASSEDRPWAA
jgi:hypothetical protein